MVDIQERIDKAERLFKSGYNCSQAVFMAFADVFELDENFAAKISLSFGGGMGRMREVCGTVSGMALCAGFISPVEDPSDMSKRTANYALTQKFAEKFRAENGHIVCRDLLGLPADSQDNPSPSVRTAEFYKKRPCVEYVKFAAKTVAEEINSLPQE